MSDAPELPEALPPADVAAAVTHTPAASSPAIDPVPETTKDDPLPMLDVHPAPHAAHSWKEFFIHIATIVLGLLIAVGLEQAVEYIRHSRELSEARQELAEEKSVNIKIFRDSAASFEKSRMYLKDYLVTLRQSLNNPAAPLPKLRVPVDFVYSQYTAWDTAQREGALAFMPSAEQGSNDRLYVGLHTLDQAEDGAYAATRHAEAVFLGGLEPHDLTLEQKTQLYRDAAEALNEIEYAQTIRGITRRFNPEFGDSHARSTPPAR